jgi:hypothetical protein
LPDSLEPIKKRKIRIIRKRINSLSARHAIGNTKANVMSRQERYLKISLLRLKSVYRNKLMSTKLIEISP